MDSETYNHPYYSEYCIKCNSCGCMYDITNNSEIKYMCGCCYIEKYEVDIYGETKETKQNYRIEKNYLKNN